MRGVKKVLPFVDDPEGDRKGTKDDEVASDDHSAIAQISRGCEDIPESVGEYSLETNSRISVRWTKDGSCVECSRTGDVWRTEIHEDGKSLVVSKHRSLEEAVEAAEALVSKRQSGFGESVAPELEDEVESILEDMDKGSVSDIGEAFGD
jgi:hypothetical protein